MPKHSGYLDGSAPLEEYCGGKAIGLRAIEYFGEPITTKQLFARATVDPWAREFIEDALQEFVFHLINAIINWDPEIVVFGGGIAAGDNDVLPYMKTLIDRFVPYPPKLRLAHYERDASLYGAIELACSGLGISVPVSL